MKQPVLRRAVMVGLALTATAVAWSRLPERLPVHWNHLGEVDRWGSRVEGALLIPAVMLVLWAIALVAPRIDPRAGSYERMRDTYVVVMDVVLGFMLVMHVAVLAYGMGYPVPVGRLVPAMLGALLLVLGNLMPRAKPNWSFGIRTPWTLSNDRVWARTHRVGGYLMSFAGLLMVVSAALPRPASHALFIFALVPAVLGPIVYSYVAWRQETAR